MTPASYLRRFSTFLALLLGSCTWQCPAAPPTPGAGENGVRAPRPEPARSDGGTDRRVPDIDGGRSEAAPREPDSSSGAGSATFEVAVISDLNGPYGSTRYDAVVVGTIARLVELRPDLVLCLGDMVAGQRAGVDSEAMWAAFHLAVTEPLEAAGIPLAVAPGNHDASSYEGYAAEREAYVRAWRSRRPPLAFRSDGAYPLHYSFVAGPAFFVALDATAVGRLDDGQLTWLRSQLDAERPSPASIVFGHLPLRPVAEGREEEFLDDPRLLSLLSDSGVDLYLAGHHHAYFPGRISGIRQVTTSALGPGSRPLLGSTAPSPRSVLWLEVRADGSLEVEALAAPSLDRPVPRSALPESVGTGDRLLRRDDLTTRAATDAHRTQRTY